MKNSTATKFLVALALVGSIVTFYATNLLLSDVSNMFYMSVTRDVITSVPCFVIALDFILASIFVMRFCSRPKYAASLTVLYSWILFAFSVVGVLTTLYSGIVIYGSMTAPYPFKYAQIVFLVFHLLMLVHSMQTLKLGRKMTEGRERRKPKASYIIYTVMLCGMVFFAFNRFGAFLLSPLYIQWSSFYMTFPFYLALLLPMALIVQVMFFKFEYVEKHPNAAILHTLIVFGMNIILGFAVMYIGYHNTQFISAISPAVAIERLLTMPIDTVLHHVFVAIFTVYELIHALIYKKKHSKANDPLATA